MPEIAEVFKLRNQLLVPLIGRTVVKFTALKSVENPVRVVKNSEGFGNFSRGVRGKQIMGIERLGKALWIQLEDGHGWHIHLNSTGWLMPGNDRALALTEVSRQKTFLHSMGPKSLRISIHFDDGQIWDWYDARMWGEWNLYPGYKMRDCPYFQSYGPDWLAEPNKAKMALYVTQTRRTLKDVLCDQHITAGIGNYMACEIAFRCELHPHTRWNTLTMEQRDKVGVECAHFARFCAYSQNNHWYVFKRKDEPCLICGTLIGYTKDRGDARGSYFCGTCQEYRRNENE